MNQNDKKTSAIPAGEIVESVKHQQIQNIARNTLEITGADVVIISTVRDHKADEAIAITHGKDVKGYVLDMARFIQTRITKAEACDHQLELLGQLLEQLEREGSPGISPESIFHKAIEEAVRTGTGFYRIGRGLTR